MTILFRCQECEKRYQTTDSRAGRRVKCRSCGTIGRIPKRPTGPRTKDGSMVRRYEVRYTTVRMTSRDEKSRRAIAKHVESHVGPIETVFRGSAYGEAEVDILWIAPTATRPVHTLITSGMSHRAMVVPDECLGFEHAELMLTLSSDWSVSEDAFRDEANYWPIRLLRTLARFPQQYETWLSVGHTVNNSLPPAAYDESTRLSASVVMPALTGHEDFQQLELADGRNVHFYSVVPLYPEEVEYKLRAGLSPLLERLAAGTRNVPGTVSAQRPNSCRKQRLFGLL